MVQYLVSATQRGVFVLNRIKAMGATGYYIFNSVTVKYGNVIHSLHLKEKFVASPFRRVTRTGFFCAQNSKLNTCIMKYTNYGNSYFFCSVVKATCAANPKKITVAI